MTELKKYKSYEFGGAYVYHIIEVDDYIAKLKAKLEEKDKEIAELQKQVHDYAQGLYVIQARAEKEARHHKYKRCLGAERVCLMELDYAFRDPCIERSVAGCVRWRKWANRWHDLAQFFKLVKF